MMPTITINYTQYHLICSTITTHQLYITHQPKTTFHLYFTIYLSPDHPPSHPISIIIQISIQTYNHHILHTSFIIPSISCFYVPFLLILL